MRLALLHANQEFVSNILASLMDSGHVVHAFREERDLLRDIGRESFDLLLIDGTLFGVGFRRFLRRLWTLAGNGVALMFINCEDSETRLAEAFALGADDFILRGVGGREITARVDAVLRRRHPAHYRRDVRLECQPYMFDLEARTLHLLDTEIALTDKEFDLAVFLFQNQGRVFSRGHLLDALWGGQSLSLTRTVDTHVSRIRKKLMINGENGYRLVSAYGSGYRLEKHNEAWVSPLLTVELGGGAEQVRASAAMHGVGYAAP